MAALFVDRSKVTFDNLLTYFKDNISSMKDPRAANVSYSLQDICLSAFSMFYLQDPSFLAFQNRMKEEKNLSNANTIFGIEEIAIDNQIRNVLDNINPNQLDNFFDDIFDLIYNSGQLNDFRFLKNQFLIAIDGTCCYHSANVNCKSCLTKTHKKGQIRLVSDETLNFKDPIKNGKEVVIIKKQDNQKFKMIYQNKKTKLIEECFIESELLLKLNFDENILYRNEENELIYQFIYNQIIIQKGHVPYKKNKKKASEIEYYHSMLTPIIASPNQSQIISLAPERITNLDGGDKQDCELNAAKRWLEKHGDKYGKLKSTILGDDLFCSEPICAEILKKKLNFIFTCKNSSHKSLYEFINSPLIETLVQKKEVINTYRFMNNVPLRKVNNAFRVNWFEITSTNSKGELLFYGTYITNHKINDANIAELAIAARCRWKVENENNNTLKTKGYNLLHSYGHGDQYLAMFLATLNIIAFLFHSILELYDWAYQKIRQHVGARVRLFEYIRPIIMLFLFAGWNHLIEFTLGVFKINKIQLDNSA